jgi:hypothetical protein
VVEVWPGPEPLQSTLLAPHRRRRPMWQPCRHTIRVRLSYLANSKRRVSAGARFPRRLGSTTDPLCSRPTSTRIRGITESTNSKLENPRFSWRKMQRRNRQE